MAYVDRRREQPFDFAADIAAASRQLLFYPLILSFIAPTHARRLPRAYFILPPDGYISLPILTYAAS